MTQNKKNLTDSLTETDLSEIIQMALSDHVTFSEIEITNKISKNLGIILLNNCLFD